MEKNRIVYLSFPIVIALVIIYLCCLIPPNDIPDIHSPFPFPVDKLVHFSMYLAFSGASFWAYIHLHKTRFCYFRAFLYCVFIPILFGGLIEIVQWKYCPGRSGDWLDLLADSLGSLFAIPFALYYKYLVEKKNANK